MSLQWSDPADSLCDHVHPPDEDEIQQCRRLILHPPIGRIQTHRKKNRQRTLLNFDSHFDLSKDLWPDLCTRIEQILHGEQALFAVDPDIEKIAQDIKRRTTLVDWTDEELWRTYPMLTDLEAVFRSLKSELGLRPVYHHQEDRCDDHLLITALACQAVQAIRQKLQERGIHESWNSLREILNQQVRVTATFKQRNCRTLHVRQATRPEGELAEIYQPSGSHPHPAASRE